MNNKRGVALVFCLVVVAILAVLSSSMFSRSISERKMSERSVTTNEALWVAEAGLAEGIDHIFDAGSVLNGSLKQGYDYNVTRTPISATYCRLVSKGTVNTSGAGLARKIEAIIVLNFPEPGNFDRAIETTGELDIRGAAHTITGENGVPNDLANAVNENAAVDFMALFGVTKAEMRANADQLYTEVTFGDPVSGITWVDVTPENQLTIDGNLVGDGILVVQGDVRISGTVEFTGVIYVIGQLSLSGTPDIFGSIIAESGADIDTTIAAGNVEITWNEEAIANALTRLNTLASREVAAWYEIKP
ncbi:MAG: hypothetical protein ABH843_06170 [Candidatus Omnitrophota bacterium]